MQSTPSVDPVPTMTDDPKLRTVLIILVILSVLFGALLLLVGLSRRGHGAAPARGRRSSFLVKNTGECPGRRLCGPIDIRLAFDFPFPHHP